ncbi:MAG: WD40 repeat domain-containing protein [Anaerolineae bacterium]|nr:WD40 repeat domain-containing protein [Anaerolineae bacterium]
MPDRELDNFPRQTLQQLLQTYGSTLCESPRRVRGLLLDLCGIYKREINLLLLALQENVAADLQGLSANIPRQLLSGYLVRRLQDNYAVTAEAARWAVESWAYALGVSLPENPLPPGDILYSEPLRILEGHTDSVTSIAFGPDRYLLASAGADDVIHLWDVVRGVLVLTLGWLDEGISSVAFNLDGDILASGRGYVVDLWDVRYGRHLRTLVGHTGTVRSVAFSTERRILVSGAYDKTIRLWDIYRGTPLRVFEGHAGAVEAVALHPEQHYIASGSWDRTVRIWDTRQTYDRQNIARVLEGHTNLVNSVAFSPDGHYLASGSSDETVRIWDVQTGQTVHILNAHTDSVWCVAFNAGGNLLASGGQDNTVCIWDVVRGTLLATLAEHTLYVTSVAFSPDDALLASASYDGTTRLWWLH